MNRSIPINRIQDIPAAYRKNAIGQLFEYHNLNKSLERSAKPRLLIGMCMDSRKHLRIPDNFAFIIRTAGANLRHSEFRVSYAIAVGGVGCIALIGHNNCGMVNLESRKELFVKGLVKHGGWKKKDALDHFNTFAIMHEIGSETDFILSETKRLRLRYPKMTVAPMLYNIENNRLYLLKEK